MKNHLLLLKKRLLTVEVTYAISLSAFFPTGCYDPRTGSVHILSEEDQCW